MTYALTGGLLTTPEGLGIPGRLVRLAADVGGAAFRLPLSAFRLPFFRRRSVCVASQIFPRTAAQACPRYS